MIITRVSCLAIVWCWICHIRHVHWRCHKRPKSMCLWNHQKSAIYSRVKRDRHTLCKNSDDTQWLVIVGSLWGELFVVQMLAWFDKPFISIGLSMWSQQMGKMHVRVVMMNIEGHMHCEIFDVHIIQGGIDVEFAVILNPLWFIATFAVLEMLEVFEVNYLDII